MKSSITQVNYPIKIPPDGGWGWIIVIANAVCNIVTLPSMTNFGLIYKDKLAELGINASQIALIINFNSAFGMGMGLFTGPLLKYFGYRKVAIFAGFLFVIGTILTAFANSFSHFIITYSLVTAAGYGLATAAFALALNTYFKERRSKAAGITMALSGFGPIFYPPLITYLLSVYGVNSCVLVLGGIGLNIVLAAVLLQPVKYHMKIKPETSTALVPNESTESSSKQEDKTEMNDVAIDIPNENDINVKSTVDEHSKTIQQSQPEHETEDDSSEAQKMLTGEAPPPSPAQESKLTIDIKNKLIEGNSNSSISSLPRSAQLYEEAKNGSNFNIAARNNRRINPNATPIERISITVSQKCKSIEWSFMKKWIVNFFDLDLLTDKRFVNILVGIAFATFAEINFSVLTPFILSELNYSTIQIATLMSTLAISDIISRFLAPFLGDFLKFSPRIMYMISLVGLIVGRTGVLFASNYQSLLLIGVGLGIAKGIRTVYMILVIPAHVSLEKLPSASGIRMVFNGLMLVILGIAVGRIMNKSGSYANCIIFINCVTLVCIILWTVELIYVNYFSKKQEQNISTSC